MDTVSLEKAQWIINALTNQRNLALNALVESEAEIERLKKQLDEKK